MPAILIDGKAIAAQIRKEIKAECDALKEKGVTPGLAVVLAGEDPASQIYVRNKERACEKTGIRSTVIRLSGQTTQLQLEEIICSLNENPEVDGILVQLPLPRGLSEAKALAKIDPAKDVDGFHARNMGALVTGASGFVPCTPKGCMELIRRAGVPVSGKEAVVIGRSTIVGKPMALLLLNENATVTLCHSKTADLKAHTKRADILVAAVGRPEMITGDMIKPGAAVIDVGINRVGDKVVGDVCFAEAGEAAGFITPVPGGVGPMTIAMLLQNTLESAGRRAQIG